MATAKSQFNVRRVAKATFNLGASTAVSTLTSGTYIPAGAIVTGIRMNAPAAVTLTNASNSIIPCVGTVPLTASIIISNLPAQTVVTVPGLLTTQGMPMSVGGELNLQKQASSGTNAFTGIYDVYVEYLYAA
jgi:hypothetical protein